MSNYPILKLLAGAALLATLSSAAADAPKIETWTTSNGARVYYVAAPEIPIVDLRVVFAGGSARDGDKPGLASLTSALLDEATEALDADALGEALAETGSVVRTGSMRDMAFASLRSMVEPRYLDPSVALFADILGKPAFADADIERLRQRTLVSIKRDAESPGTIAQDAFYRAVYADHPYATPVKGTEASVKAITAADIKAFYQRYYVAKNAVIGIVGAVDKRAAKALSEQITAAMAAGGAAPALPKVAPLRESNSVTIEHPSIQSHVRMGQPGMRRGDPDYFPLLVGNHVLGGNGLVSLLFDEVRDKRGLSYSVYSYFAPMSETGPFISGLQTDASQLEEAETVLRDTIAGFVRNGPDPEALKEAKMNLVGGFPLQISTNTKIIDYVTMIGFYDLPLDYLETFTDSVEAVTMDDVRDAFARRLSVDKMVSVRVGGAAGG
ncbi:MAG: insulinase family protein [Gammaproteobacteria bacterium]|nr:insulinase family protein [Gammaproteobacteria bacterium]NNM01090.1 insulinase family protein [Gammaproteobacteria bacterium]